jgi:tRNA threonylcarbamoyladenosine biosynthesis protein TsaB
VLLAIDTATATASIALYDTERQQLLFETTWQARRRHTQELMPTVERALARANIAAADLTALAVTTGPGSFTGVRIGISAVKGLSMGLPQPPAVVGIPTLAVTAAPWHEAAASVRPAAQICAFIQAGRGRYNWAWFGAQDAHWRPGREDHAAGDVTELATALAAEQVADGGPVWLVGEMDQALGEAVAPIVHVTALDAVSGLRRAGNLAHLGARLLAAGTADDLAVLQPLYLRNP